MSEANQLESTRRWRETAWLRVGASLTLLAMLVALQFSLWSERSEEIARQRLGHADDAAWARDALELRLSENRERLQNALADAAVDESSLESDKLLAVLDAIPEVENVAWLDADHKPLAFARADASRFVTFSRLAEGTIAEGLEEAHEKREPLHGVPFEHTDGFVRFELYLPSFEPKRGTHVVQYRLQPYLETAVPQGLKNDYHLRVLDAAGSPVGDTGSTIESAAERAGLASFESHSIWLGTRTIEDRSVSLYLAAGALALAALFALSVGQGVRSGASRRRKQRRIESANTFLQSIVDGFTDGIVAVDRGGHVQLWNSTASSTIGADPGGPLREWPQRIGLHVPSKDEHYGAEEHPLARALRGEIVKDIDIWVDNDRIPSGVNIRGSARPYMGDDAEIAGAVFVFRDVTDEKLVNGQILAARHEAIESNQAKSTFLSYMSHEIRTPMTSILGYADLLVESSSDSKTLKFAEEITQSGRELLGLLDDILELAKIEAGLSRVDREPTSPFDVIDEVLERLEAEADRLGVTLSFEYTGAVPEQIVTDSGRLVQVLMSVLAVALETEDITFVRVLCGLLGGKNTGESYLSFEILDTELEITQEDLGGLFRAYARADAPTMLLHGKTGLRLAVSKRLAQMLGGDIIVRHKRGRVGSILVRIGVGALENVTLVDGNARTNRIEAVTTPEPNNDKPLEGRRVLLADDDPVIRRLVAPILEEAGARVKLAEDGKGAVEMTFHSERLGRHYDAVLIDLRMPVLNGTDATLLLRKYGYTGAIVGLTASSQPEEREQFIETGGDVLLDKPIAKSRLLETLSKVLAGSGVDA